MSEYEEEKKANRIFLCPPGITDKPDETDEIIPASSFIEGIKIAAVRPQPCQG
jgi:hypothetical protein